MPFDPNPMVKLSVGKFRDYATDHEDDMVSHLRFGARQIAKAGLRFTLTVLEGPLVFVVGHIARYLLSKSISDLIDELSGHCENAGLEVPKQAMMSMAVDPEATGEFKP